MQGWYDVPQNPITAQEYGVAYTPTLGEIMPGSLFVVPQNPITSFATGNVLPLAVQPGAPGMVNGQPVGMSGCGCGGACGGAGACGCGGGGLGDISTDLSTFFSDLTAGNWSTAFMTDTIFGIQAWIVVAAAAGLAWWALAGTGPSRATRAYRYTRRKVAAVAAA